MAAERLVTGDFSINFAKPLITPIASEAYCSAAGTGKGDVLLKFDVVEPDRIKSEHSDSDEESNLSSVQGDSDPNFLRRSAPAEDLEDVLRPSVLECGETPIERKDLEVVLNEIHPPWKCGKDESQVQFNVSHKLPHPSDIIILEKKMDNLLAQRMAQSRGICPMRRKLYDDCFDEVIRHIALSSDLHRGKLFLKVREEFNRTRDTYLRLYEETVSYLVYKTARSHLGQLRQVVSQLKKDNAALTTEYELLTQEHKKNTNIHNQELDLQGRKNADEMYFLRQMHIRSKKLVEAIPTLMERPFSPQIPAPNRRLSSHVYKPTYALSRLPSRMGTAVTASITAARSHLTNQFPEMKPHKGMRM